MKKNVMMRLAAILLVCVLASTCGISGTYAKYVTEGTASDTARVAKWGVTVVGTAGLGNQMFAQEYASDTDSFTGVTVAASENVVAPGTSGTLSNFSVTGTPEVAVNVSYTVDLTLTGWENASGEYCPIIIYVNKTPYYINGVDINTVADLIANVEYAIQTAAKTYGPGTDLSQVNDDLTVSWEWAYEGGIPGQTDGKDTELGNWSSKGKAAPTIKLDITCVVTQIN